MPPGRVGLIKGRIRRNGPDGPEPWIDNGDLGRISSDGRLFVVGRTAHIQDLSAISIGKISPEQEVEHLLRFEWDAADAAAVLVNDSPSVRRKSGWVSWTARMPMQESLRQFYGIEVYRRPCVCLRCRPSRAELTAKSSAGD